MSDIQLYLLEYDSDRSGATNIAAQTATKLDTKSIKLLDLIESLGEFLKSNDDPIRIKTLAYLSDVLSSLSKKTLTLQQRRLLTDFIVERISSDSGGINHASTALVALESMGAYDSEQVKSIMGALFDSAIPISQFAVQRERYAILTLVDLIMAKYRNALKTVHEEDPNFLPSFIALLRREKDPRNLMIIFSMIQAPMVEWDVSKDAQELFEFVFDYFPITFRPPPNDPYGITAQDLKDRLRECISATSYFAPHAFPALLDKLDSTSINVKRDSLQAIEAGIQNYGPATINLYSVTLWDALKYEILNSQEEDLAEEALKALRAIAKILGTSTHEGPLQAYLKPVAKECNQHLEDTPTKQSAASGRILNSIAKGCPEASSILIKAVLPQILALYKSADNIPRRKGLMEVLNHLIQANIDLYGRWRTVNTTASDATALTKQTANLRVATNPFDDYTPQCLDLYNAAIQTTPVKEVSYRLMALEGLRYMAMVRQLVSDASIANVVKLLNNIILHEESYGADEVKTAASDALVEIAHQKPQIVVDNAIPLFMAELPDSDADGSKQYVPVLEAIAKLSTEPQVFSTIIIRLKNKLYTALRQNASTAYITAILSAILYAFTRDSLDLGNPSISAPQYTDIVLPFLRELCNPDATIVSSPALKDPKVLEIIGRICNAIIRPQQWVAQTEVCRNVYLLFREQDVQTVAPFTISPTADMTMPVSTFLIAALHREAKPHPDIPELLLALIKYATTPDPLPAPIRQAAIDQIALLTNKFVSARDTPTTITPITTSLLDASTLTTPRLLILFAILRALLLRTDASLPTLIPATIALLAHPTHGALAARLFASLLSPSSLLTKPNHAVVYALHKQRFFALAVPALLAGYRAAASSPSAPAHDKENHLAALAASLPHLPYALYRPDLPKLAPLLLAALAHPQPEPVAGALAALADVVAQDPAVVEEHVGSLVTRLLVVATGETAGAKGVGAPAVVGRGAPPARAAALRVLAACVGALRDEKLVPYQRATVRRLAVALDDGRRTVRAEAVLCRAKWAVLAGAVDDDE